MELPDILVLHGGRLLDEGRRLGHALNGVALDNQLILLILAVLNCDTGVHPHLPDELLSKEVTDLNKSASLGDGAVDWEMRIHSSNRAQVSQGESLEHVLDVAADSPHGSDL